MARSSKASTSSGDFVTVACKLPQGLTIVIPPMGEQREQRVTLHGRYSPYAIGEHGMTQVKADVWATIQMVHAEQKWLTNEHVFALRDQQSASDKAEERAEVNAGFNKIDPAKPNQTLAARGIQREGDQDYGINS